MYFILVDSCFKPLIIQKLWDVYKQKQHANEEEPRQTGQSERSSALHSSDMLSTLIITSANTTKHWLAPVSSRGSHLHPPIGWLTIKAQLSLPAHLLEKPTCGTRCGSRRLIGRERYRYLADLQSGGTGPRRAHRGPGERSKAWTGEQMENQESLSFSLGSRWRSRWTASPPQSLQRRHDQDRHWIFWWFSLLVLCRIWRTGAHLAAWMSMRINVPSMNKQ